jgi:hypothetical protein
VGERNSTAWLQSEHKKKEKTSSASSHICSSPSFSPRDLALATWPLWAGVDGSDVTVPMSVRCVFSFHTEKIMFIFSKIAHRKQNLLLPLTGMQNVGKL